MLAPQVALAAVRFVEVLAGAALRACLCRGRVGKVLVLAPEVALVAVWFVEVLAVVALRACLRWALLAVAG
jgi:hypothetical protein